MPAVIVQQPAGVERRVLTPHISAVRDGNGRAPVARPERPNVDKRDFAYRALLNQLARFGDWGVVEEILGGSEERVGGAGGFGYGVHLLHRPGGGLLAGHMLAGGETVDYLLGVQISGGEQLDGVHVRVFEDVFVVVVNAGGYSPLRRLRARPFRNGVAKRDDLATLMREIAGRVQLRNSPASDNRQFYLVHASALHRWVVVWGDSLSYRAAGVVARDGI